MGAVSRVMDGGSTAWEEVDGVGMSGGAVSSSSILDFGAVLGTSRSL